MPFDGHGLPLPAGVLLVRKPRVLGVPHDRQRTTTAPWAGRGVSVTIDPSAPQRRQFPERGLHDRAGDEQPADRGGPAGAASPGPGLPRRVAAGAGGPERTWAPVRGRFLHLDPAAPAAHQLGLGRLRPPAARCQHRRGQAHRRPWRHPRRPRAPRLPPAERPRHASGWAHYLTRLQAAAPAATPAQTPACPTVARQTHQSPALPQATRCGHERRRSKDRARTTVRAR